MTILSTTPELFNEDVTQSEIPVVVDIWASWCGPCKMMAPMLDELAIEHNEIKFLKLKVDDAKEFVKALQVSSVPTLLFYQGGKLLHRQTGATTKENVRSTINRVFE